ncbi:MAG: GntR family transcriptional regulator [Microbacteriaceae bacterium]|nr:GntR family transcriptional regulator [Microbacteriaceae bacterium]
MAQPTQTDESRVDTAYSWLLGEITGFRLRAGAPLSENSLAKHLGISRTPVREALQRLEKEGLVRRTENSRFTVSQINAREVNEACDLLEVLDSFIMRRASSKLDEESKAELLRIVDLQQEAAAHGDRDAWAEADTKFHRLLNTVADNKLVAEVVKETRRRTQRFWLRAAGKENRLVGCSAEHRVIAEAIIAKDYDTINSAVSEHIQHMRQGMLDLVNAVALVLGE